MNSRWLGNDRLRQTVTDCDDLSEPGTLLDTVGSLSPFVSLANQKGCFADVVRKCSESSPIGNSASLIRNSQRWPPEDEDISSGIGQGIRHLHASITLSRALSRRDCWVVRNIVHVDEGVKRARATRPGFTGGAELRWGVSKFIIRLDYNNL